MTMSMFLNPNPEHLIACADTVASCSCGWFLRADTWLGAEHAAGAHYAQTRVLRVHLGERVDGPRVQCSDMPEFLSEGERIAYLKGWNRAATKYAKDHGLPSQQVTETFGLFAATRSYNRAREVLAHKAGMSALNSYRRAHGLTVPKAVRKAKAALPEQCPHCGGSLTAVAS